MVPPLLRFLPDGRRLHCQHGPIDLVIDATGDENAVRAAFAAAAERFRTILPELCDELPALRRAVEASRVSGPVARRMHAATLPYAVDGFITPMAAVAGAVADAVLGAMTAAAPLRRASVNNGGDIALHLAPGEEARIGLVDRPDRPELFGRATVRASDRVGGVATSGWRGRSFSLGIADAVTIAARSAAEADAAATVVANAVDLPGHPAVLRVPAREVQADSDLGSRLVTRDVGALTDDEVRAALASGLAKAEELVRRGLIGEAALHLSGLTMTTSVRLLSPRLLAQQAGRGRAARVSGRPGDGAPTRKPPAESSPHPVRLRSASATPPLPARGERRPATVVEAHR